MEILPHDPLTSVEWSVTLGNLKVLKDLTNPNLKDTLLKPLTTYFIKHALSIK